MVKKFLKIRYFIYLSITCGVLLILFTAFHFNPEVKIVVNTTPSEFENWKICFEDGSCKKITFPANVSAGAGEQVVLQNTALPQMEGQTIAFRTVNQNICVKLDGEELYRYDQKGKGLFVASPGTLWHFITLPNQFEKGVLTIEMDSPYANLGGRLTGIIWGARSACILNFMYSQWVPLLLGFAVLIIGLVFIFFYYTLGHLKLQNSGIFYFAFSAILLAVNMIITTGMLQIFYGNAVVYYLIRYMTLYYLMIPFLIFLARTIMKGYERILTGIAAVCMCIFWLAVLLQFTGLVDLYYFALLMWTFYMLLFLCLAGMVIGNIVKRQFQLIHVLLGLFCVLEVGFVLADYAAHREEQVGLRHYGIVLLFLLLGFYSIIRVFKQYRMDLEKKLELNNQTVQALTKSQAGLSKQLEAFEAAKEEAEEMNALKNVFLGNVSKKLLLPMNRIMGLNELILRDDVNENVREKASNIQTEGSVMQTLINNISDYSKVDNGELEIKPVAYHVENFLYDMSEMASIGIIDKKIDFIVHFSPDIPRELLGDEIRLRQIVTNILNNAIKYTEEGTIRFRVNAEITNADEVLLSISISDTGIGIQEDQMKNLFENFLMNDVSSPSELKRSGLGLAVCKRLIDLMGGSIDVNSKLGEGTVFNISIPQKIINGMPLVEKGNWNFKALIFETNAIQRMIMKNNCLELGIDADFTCNDAEFQSALESEVYHTVLICEEKYPNYQDYLNSDVCAGIRTVILVDVSNSMNTYENADILQRPIQCMNLYDAISGNELVEPIMVENVLKFIAPQAEILIVDDNPSNIKIALGLLEPYKMQITTALNGRECLELLKSEKRFDLVFLDYNMPETSGVEILHEIREMDEKYYKTLPIIAMTSRKINGAKEIFISEGFDHYIDKPFETVHLEKLLETFLAKEKIIHNEQTEDKKGL